MFAPNTVVCLGVSGKTLYARGSVVQKGSKLVGKYSNQKLSCFVELTSLQSVADQCTVVFPKDAVYVVHERYLLPHYLCATSSLLARYYLATSAPLAHYVLAHYCAQVRGKVAKVPKEENRSACMCIPRALYVYSSNSYLSQDNCARSIEVLAAECLAGCTVLIREDWLYYEQLVYYHSTTDNSTTKIFGPGVPVLSLLY